MTFDVKYKIENAYDLCFVEFPNLRIKYRKAGALKYSAMVFALDKHAKDLGYGGYSSSMDFDFYTYDQRVKYFNKALSERYESSMEKYVAEFAKKEIIEEMRKNEHDENVNRLVSGWLTNGWEHVQVKIANDDSTSDKTEVLSSKKQHPNG